MIDPKELEAKEDLVRKMTTPPPDLFEEPPITSYEKLNEIAGELRSEQELEAEKWTDLGQAMWNEAKKK